MNFMSRFQQVCKQRKNYYYSLSNSNNDFESPYSSSSRPIVEYMATPLWSKMSDRFQKGKIMLIIAVASWILFTLPVGFVRPPVVSCKYYNGTQGRYSPNG
jgi:hypothetical protein